MTQKEFLGLCVSGSRQEIEEALESGANANKKSYIYGAKVSPIFVAVMEENTGAIKALVKYGARPADGLSAAIMKGKKKFIKLLVDLGADVNGTDSNDNNPLLLAVTADSPKVVKWLIEFGADVNKRSNAGYTPLTYTVLTQLKEFRSRFSDRKVSPDIIVQLMKAGADYDEAMIFAVKSGNIPYIKLLLKNGADINKLCMLETPQTPLAAAIFMADNGISADMIKFLAENGADLNEIFELSPETSTNALNVSITVNRPDIADILLSNGADPDYCDPTGRTALVYAVMTGSEILRVLLEHGANPNIPDKDGRTPLMLAALDVGCEPEILELLIEHGADVNAQDNEGMTALLWTVAGKDRTPGFMLSAMIRTGGFMAEGGDSWFLVAAVYIALKREAQLNAVRLLVANGADVDLADDKGMNAMMCAMMSMDDEIIEILTEAKKLKQEKGE